MSDEPDLEGALDRFGETAMRIKAERDDLVKALAFIASQAGRTLLSTEHGQPYSIGAHDAFNQLAEVASEALSKVE